MILLESDDASHVTLAPRIVFPEPVVIPRAVLCPSAVLRDHEVILRRVLLPIPTFSNPVDAVPGVPKRAWYPIATLLYAVLLAGVTVSPP